MKGIEIYFSTSEYEWNHDKAPRGFGWWMFKFEGHTFEAKGTYTEAKKACKAEVKRLAPIGYQGCVFVDVLP